MEDLNIEPTKKTPSVEFHSSGRLVMAGCAYPENAKEFFDPVIEWVDQLSTDEVIFDLIVDYINTASAKKLLELLKRIDMNSSIKEFNLNWFYEEDDEDNLETGKILSEMLSKAKFKYVEYEKPEEEIR